MYNNNFILREDILLVEKPIYAAINLTNRCNFRCKHCYVKSQKNLCDNELTLSKWKSILDILKNNGVFILTLTGGEILSYPEFWDVYKYAYDLGFKLKLISNLSLFNDAYLELFKTRKPEKIVVSLYGITNDTYHSFCEYYGSVDKIYKNLLLLKNNDINVEVNIILNEHILREYLHIIEFLKVNNIIFHLYRKIFCETTGNMEPLQLRIDPKQEFESYLLVKDINQLEVQMSNKEDLWEEGIKFCTAGLTSFFIDSEGYASPCAQTSEHRFNILENDYASICNNMRKIRNAEICHTTGCSVCEFRNYCGKCVPLCKKMGITQSGCFEKSRAIYLKKELEKYV